MPDCTRREFSARVAASVSATLVTAGACANDVNPKSDSKAKPVGEPTGTSSPQNREEHLLAALLDRYPGSHLTTDMLEGIRGGLMHNRRLAERIRAVPLSLDTEPAFQFRVYRGN
jgi:hypothetical protein